MVATLALCITAACVGSDGGYTGGPHSFAESTSTRHAGSRAILDLAALGTLPFADAPLFVEGRFTGVEPDRGWRSLEEEEITDSIDSVAVEFEDPSSFRTVTATLDVDAVLRSGGAVSTETARVAQAGGSLEVTFVLHNDTSLESAREDLMGFGRVIVPLAQVERGPFGLVIEPFGGGDMVIRVNDGEQIDMPLAADEVSEMTRGAVRTREELIRAISGEG